MPPRAALTLSGLLAWLSHLGYPSPSAQQSVLVMLEGCVPDLNGAQGGDRYQSGAQGAHGDLWEAASGAQVPLQAGPNALDQLNDTGCLLWQDGGAPRLGVFVGSSNPGSRLSRASGWPQLGDGSHPYRQSARNDNGQPCLRSGHNRVLREVSPVPGVGGDGVLTLSEVVSRGMVPNGSILVHPGQRATASAGCLLTSGGYTDPAWMAVWGWARMGGGIVVVLHDGADLVRWLAEGRPNRPPLLRPGCNALRWVAPLQAALGVRPDGVYGPATAAALLAARKSRGLSGAALEDARVTPDEWQALTGRATA